MACGRCDGAPVNYYTRFVPAHRLVAKAFDQHGKTGWAKLILIDAKLDLLLKAARLE
jgi:hypothetical protein